MARRDIYPRRGLPRWARSALLTVHVVGAIIWVGLIGMLVLLYFTTDAVLGQTRNAPAAYASFGHWIGLYFLAPSAALTLVTGPMLAARSYGYTRYWWIIAKIVISLGLVAGGMASFLGLVTAPVPTLVIRCAGLAALLAAVVLSVTKPGGKRRQPRPGGRHRGTYGHWPIPVA